jgi:hypothetical protein
MDAAEMPIWRRLYYTRFRDVLRGRFDASLDRQKIVAEAGLPADVADLVLQVVRRSKLWRSEQVDVAKELAAHFQDGLAAGQTPKQLVGSFGDPQQAAQLIRRAKKRGRPLIWYLWHYGWCMVATLVGLYILAGLYLMMGRPTIKTDYLAIINQRAASVPEEKRAWPLYREALGEMLVNGFFPKWARNPELAPSDAAWAEATGWLKEHEPALRLMRAAAKRSDLGFPVWSSIKSFRPEDRKVLQEIGDRDQVFGEPKYEPLEDRMLIGALLPHAQVLRRVAQLLMIDARRAGSVGNGDTALADVIAILGVGRHSEETPFLVTTFVGVAIREIAFAAIQETVADHPALWTDAQLGELAHAVAAADINWQRGFEGERASFCDVVQRLYTDDGNGDGRITAEGLRRVVEFANVWDIDRMTGLKAWRMRFGDLAVEAVAPASVLVMAPRREVVDKYDQLMEQWKAKMHVPFWELSETDWKDPLADWTAADKLRYLPLSLMTPPDLRKGIESYNGVRDGVLIGIALELYHREHGAWPQSLNDLSPRWLPSVPVDRITGEPLHYKIVDDRPVVYSVGIDRDDDGGRVPIGEDGEPNPHLASLFFAESKPAVDPAHVGDWVIWSTQKEKQEGVASEDK